MNDNERAYEDRTKQDLSSIYIRVCIGGKWKTKSVLELVESGHGNHVLEWFYRRLFSGALPSEMTIFEAMSLIDIVEGLGIPVYRVLAGDKENE